MINALDARAEDDIGLEEFKPRFDGRFYNRFERVGEVTRYTVSAEIRAKGAWRLLLGPWAGGLVRRRIARNVLLPLKHHLDTAHVRGGADADSTALAAVDVESRRDASRRFSWNHVRVR
ncbi:MAG TPA: hypothetical protein VLD35_00920 [Caldimonas sp.]|nr:hypothetical protein [Caldimonas sp.]